MDCKIDQKHEAVKSAPTTLDLLNEESKIYFDEVIAYLNAAEIDYEIAPRLVRGLDYYSHTVFEIEADIAGFGAQNVLGGGGRYQNLVKELGGPDLGGIGFACGMERLLMALDALEIDFSKDLEVDAFIVTTSPDLRKHAMKLLYDLRSANLVSDMNYTQKSFKGQFKQALRLDTKYLLILGDEEFNRGMVSIKDTKTEVQEEIKLNEVVTYLTQKLEK